MCRLGQWEARTGNENGRIKDFGFLKNKNKNSCHFFFEIFFFEEKQKEFFVSSTE
jgi:hypothetical protein